MLLLDDGDGLLLWPRGHVALLRVDRSGRVEATSATGEVAHRPPPLSDVRGAPFVRIARDVLANPAHATVEDGRWTFPGGRGVASSKPAQPVRGARPRDPAVPGTDLRASDVLYLRGQAGRAYWHTARGRVPAGTSADQAAAGHDWLVKAGRGQYVNLARVRAIRSERKRFRLILDNGGQITLSDGADAGLLERLGLTGLYHLEPRPPAHQHLYREGIREWPFALWEAEPEVLRRHFRDARRLIANVIYQLYCWRQDSLPLPPGDDHRGTWYDFIVGTLVRGGFLRQSAPIRLDPGYMARGGSDPMYALYEELLMTMVGDYRLFTYRELGFKDVRPDFRRIGRKNPHVVILCEKTSLEDGLHLLVSRYDASYLILGGLPSLLATEYFCAHLPTDAPLVVIAYVDFDPSGWIAAKGFVKQLQRYGRTVRHLGYLIRPTRYTPAELARHAFPLDYPTPQIRGKIEAWLRESGGVNGASLSIYADSFPLDRLPAAFEEELAATTSSPTPRGER